MIAEKVESLCELFEFLCSKYIKFFFQNLENGREERNGCVYRLLLVLIMKKIFSIDFPNFENKILCILNTNM